MMASSKTADFYIVNMKVGKSLNINPEVGLSKIYIYKYKYIYLKSQATSKL